MLTDEDLRRRVTDWCRAEGIEALDATVREGTIVLSGTLPTLRHARLIERELVQQREVTSVVTSAIRIEPRRPDAQLAREVEEIHSGCGCPHVSLDVFEGVVSMSGDEPDLNALQLLEDRLSGVPGVVDIRSTVTLRSSSQGFERESQTAPAGA
ncbi:MAG: BON domain-containing protein [Myxococcales bacterium]|nr:BON domain-containing protein [Myxococcales bacterium]